MIGKCGCCRRKGEIYEAISPGDNKGEYEYGFLSSSALLGISSALY